MHASCLPFLVTISGINWKSGTYRQSRNIGKFSTIQENIQKTIFIGKTAVVGSI